MKRKVTSELREKLVDARKEGMTYKEISGKFGVSKWICMTYLKHIPINKSYIEKKWKKAEEEARKILIKNEFFNILNLNEICSSPYWDYYAEKEKEKWLIDVTIDEKKSVVEKYSRAVAGFICAILYKNGNDEWKLVKINTDEISLQK